MNEPTEYLHSGWQPQQPHDAERQETDRLGAMLDEVDRRMDKSPTCSLGHPLIVITTGKFWLTVEDGKVGRAVVIADAGDAGCLDAEWIVWGCNCASRCEGTFSDETAQMAIKIAQDSTWENLELEG